MNNSAVLPNSSCYLSSLLLLEDGQRKSFAAKKGEWLIGRSENSYIRAANLDVSARHAVLRIDGLRAYIRDMGSTNGTFLDGKRLPAHQEVELPAGSFELTLGLVVRLQFIAHAQPSEAADRPALTLVPQIESDALDAPVPSPVTAPAPSAREIRADSVVERARKRAMAEIEAIQAEAVNFSENIKEEARREVAMIREETQREISVVQATITELRHERERVRTECHDIKSEQETINHALDRIRGEHDALQNTCGQLQAENQALEEEIKTQDTRNEELRREHTQLLQDKKTLDSVRTQLTEAEAALRSEKIFLEEAREVAARERAVWEAEDRRRKALDTALEAELNVKRLEADARLAETDLKRIEAEREIQRLLGRHQEAERETEKIRLEADRYFAEAERRALDAEKRVLQAQEASHVIEQDAQKSREKSERFKRESEQRQSAIQDQEGTLAALRRKVEECTRETHAATITLEEAKQRIAAESETLRAAAQNEIARLRKAAADEVAALKKAAIDDATALQKSGQDQVVALRKAAQEEMDSEAEAKRAQRTAEFAEQGRAMERELADAKVREMKVIQAMQEEERKAARARVEAIYEDLVTRTLALARQAPIEKAEAELRTAIRSALEGKNTASLSLDADERTRKFWKKVAVRASVPAGIGLFFLIFPGIPGAIKERFSRTVASEKDETGVFLDQIKQRGLKFQPEMTLEYRSTYSDNLLYLEAYAEMKLSDAEQKEWTLMLNDFIVGRLGLSDRVIPDFISEEAVMVRELMRIREGILPQFKEQGLARLTETENAGRAKLEYLLQGTENYAKFRNFEKSFHDGFLRRRKGDKR